ncbi:MAG TPA: hypothetical protein VEL81_02245 [Thermoplasmata archaeon]|nr:hypothetical protein [Thermoplasmata archaeon]
MTLPEALLSRTERFIRDHPELGWATVTEYVRDAIRRTLPEDEKKAER